MLGTKYAQKAYKKIAAHSQRIRGSVLYTRYVATVFGRSRAMQAASQPPPHDHTVMRGLGSHAWQRLVQVAAWRPA